MIVDAAAVLSFRAEVAPASHQTLVPRVLPRRMDPGSAREVVLLGLGQHLVTGELASSRRCRAFSLLPLPRSESWKGRLWRGSWGLRTRAWGWRRSRRFGHRARTAHRAAFL